MTTTRDLPVLPAIVDGSVSHQRQGPIRRRFRHRIYQWLIDLDQIPRLPWYLRPVAGFDARDHIGGIGQGATGDIRTNVDRFLAVNDVDLGPGSRIIMLANARVLGHVFDPLTVYWCFDAEGVSRCVIAEVHNTYGERHAYLLRPDANGEAQAGKHLYVSPFYDVSGYYAMKFTIADNDVKVSISLVRAGRIEFDAVLTGVPTPATRRAVARFALRTPLMPQRVSALIRAHGTWLWIRKLPIVDRPPHVRQEGV